MGLDLTSGSTQNLSKRKPYVTRRTTESFQEEVRRLTSGKYLVLGEFTKTNIKTTFLHTSCGQRFEMTPHHFIRGSRCPHCSKGRGYSKTQIELLILEAAGPTFHLISNYQSIRKPVTLFHESCQKFFAITPERFLRQSPHCPYCEPRLKKKSSSNIIRSLSEK